MDNKVTKSLIDKTIHSVEYNPRIVVNEGSKNIKNTLIYNLKNSDRFDIAVSYVVWSGFSLLKEQLKKYDSKSRFLVTTEGLVTDPNSLKGLLELDIKVKVYNPFSNSRGFHLKSYLFEKDDNVSLLVGSNNISIRALGSVHEMAMEVEASNNGYIVEKYQKTFNDLWEDNASFYLTQEFIDSYTELYNYKVDMDDVYFKYQLDENKILPNYMQEMALLELEVARSESNRGLVIAATGTGKTYLSAFDVEKSQAKKVLFLVHNRLILKDAINTYKKVFKDKTIIELNTNNLDEIDSSDFIFTTDKTAYSHLIGKYVPTYFDYIIFDEAHKIGSDTLYNKIISYFEPSFTLGITATPERTDNPRHLFETFNYNVPYEIRLLDAMNSELVCPFTYYGFDLEDKLLGEGEKFNYRELALYLKGVINDKGHYGAKLKALVFTSSISEANELSAELNKIGYISKAAVSGGANDEEIGDYINSLKSNEENTIELITTVNKFNEGIDIPDVNMIIMLRNTTSSIIYLQQLGRGLRRTADPEKFVTIIDIIGNSKNNYTIAEVLTGNKTKDKRVLLKHVNSGFNEISPFINVNIEEQSIKNIIRSITNDFKVETELKRKFKNEIDRYYQIPTLFEMFKNENFNEFELLQLLSKNFFTPFSNFYKEKYDIDETNSFLRTFFTLITQFVFRVYDNNTLLDYVDLLKGNGTKNHLLKRILLPKLFEGGITTAINSNYFKESYNNPSPFQIVNDTLILGNDIIPKLNELNAFNLFLEHIELFEYLSTLPTFTMKPFDLVDKAEFLFLNGANDCYMNVVGERINRETKKIYCTIKISSGKTPYDNKIVDDNKILYHTQSDKTFEKAEEKKNMLINEDYEFVVCAVFPHLGYSNTSYFNLGKVKGFVASEVIENNSKFNTTFTLELENKIPEELLIYKEF